MKQFKNIYTTSRKAYAMQFLTILPLTLLCSALLLPAMEIPNKKPSSKKPESNPLLMMMLIGEGRPHDALLLKAMDSDDPKEAYGILDGLTELNSNEKWHAGALIYKGQMLAKGEGVKQDRNAALDCYLACYKKHRDPMALLTIGNHYEEESKTADEFEKAAGYFKKAFANGTGDPMAGYRYARLIYNENIKPEHEEVTDILKYAAPAVVNSITEALYLFASTLLDNNHDSFAELGLPAFLQAAKQGDAFSALQLGIFYKNGLYVPKDKEFAQAIFNKALATEDTPLNMTAKAYMYKHGLGVAKDTVKAKKLLDEARPSLDANQSFIDNLFCSEDDKLTAISDPAMLRTQPIAAQEVNQPVLPKPTQIVESKEPTDLKIEKPVQKNDEKKDALIVPIKKEISHKTLLDKCNELSLKQDGSSLEIDIKNNKIFVHDPQYKNEFIVPFEEAEFQHNANIVQFMYDKRIKAWFTKTLKKLKADPEIRWKISTHRFGKAVDYLMQLVGLKNPFVGKKKDNDRLLHEAESITQKNRGHFEYTFRKQGANAILYHRHYRPYKAEPKEKPK